MSGWLWLALYAGIVLGVFVVAYRLDKATPTVHPPRRVQSFDDCWEQNRGMLISGEFDPVAEAERVAREAAE